MDDLSLPVSLFVIGMTIMVGGFERTWLDGRAIEWPASEPLALALGVGANPVGSNIANTAFWAALFAGRIVPAARVVATATPYLALL